MKSLLKYLKKYFYPLACSWCKATTYLELLSVLRIPLCIDQVQKKNKIVPLLILKNSSGKGFSKNLFISLFNMFKWIEYI